jgi:CHAD domain-containing protein
MASNQAEAQAKHSQAEAQAKHSQTEVQAKRHPNAPDKWIHGLRPDMPLAEAARQVLRVRLDVIGHFLPLAVSEADKDPEHVHQLRVATRRAGTALDTFAPCLPGGTYDTARKQLKTLRRAAGAARDWDVFVMALRERHKLRSARNREGLDFLYGYARGQRDAAQEVLEDAHPGPPNDIMHLVENWLSELRSPQSRNQPRTLADLARISLAGLLQELNASVARDLDDYGNLHQVRIAGKRLRYTMEIVADCFPPPFREEVYPRVEEMQDILGRANDSHVAAKRLSDLCSRLKKSWHGEWKHLRSGLESLLRYHKRRLKLERKQFDKWWAEWQRSGSESKLAST